MRIALHLGLLLLLALTSGASSAAPAAAAREPVSARPVVAPASRPAAVAGLRIFNGQVLYQPRGAGAAPVPMGGVEIVLIGTGGRAGDVELARTTASSGGRFTLSSDDAYAGHRLEIVTPRLPRGYLPVDASSSGAREILDAHTIDYADAGPGTYDNNLFTVGDLKPFVTSPVAGPYYLIVAPQAIIQDGALDEFVDFKRRLGFVVEVISIETVDSTFAGANRLFKVRNLEIARRQTYGSRFRYVLLVGPDSVIPFAKFVLKFTGYTGGVTPTVKLNACQDPTANSLGYTYSEWPYADLFSDFDSNGNGCLADGWLSKAADRAPNYTPDAKPLLQATVAVGRMPYSDPNDLRAALKNTLAFEQQSEAFKLQTLLAMSLSSVKGQYWTNPGNANGSYQPCGGPQWSTRCSSATIDGAYLAEAMRSGFLNSEGYASTVFYENQPAITNDSPYNSPVPLTEPNVAAELEQKRHGMVNLNGHGNSEGVYRTYWAGDANGNNMVDQPTAPFPPGNMSVNEITGSPNLLTLDALNGVTPDYGRGSIYIVAACSTGSPENLDSFGATVLTAGHGIAWIGALSVVNVRGWLQPTDGGDMSTDYYVTRQLLNRDLRVGDAVWIGLEHYNDDVGLGSESIALTLYGDPSLSYWGNPGGQSTLAAWPMLRHDNFGQGRVSLLGPSTPGREWTATVNPTYGDAIPRSPVLDKSGEVIVANGAAIDVLREGALYQKLNLDGLSYGTPAIAADGTIYALDVSGNLYAFPYSIPWIKFGSLANSSSNSKAAYSGPQRYRRWKLDIGGSPLTSPVVGPDGFAVAAYGSTNSGIAVVRPDGAKTTTALAFGPAIHELAVGADRMIYVTTSSNSQDALKRIDLYCPGFVACQAIDVPVIGAPVSTPPLLSGSSVFLGKANGVVAKFAADTLAGQGTFQADSKITAGPVAGPGNQILVGTQNGTLYSLRASDLSLRWQKTLTEAVDSVPAFSGDALYVVSNDRLYAFHPHTGAELWSHFLVAGAGGGSAAVGYDRVVYVQTREGTVAAVGEGWGKGVVAVSADSVQTSGGAVAIKVEWTPQPRPVPPGGGRAAVAAAQTVTPTGLLLQRSADDGDWADLARLAVGTEVYTDTTVLPNKSYAYRVQVLTDGRTDSDFVMTPWSIRSLPSLPAAPRLASVTPVAADALQLAWTTGMSDVIAGFRVERSLHPNGPFAPVAQPGGQLRAYRDPGLLPNTRYYYRVVALNASGESGASNVDSAVTRRRTLAPPQNVQASFPLSGAIKVAWTGGLSTETAVIEFLQDGFQGFRPLAQVRGDGVYYHVFDDQTAYTYRVKFVAGDEESDWQEAPFGVDTRAAPPTPTPQLHLPVIRGN